MSASMQQVSLPPQQSNLSPAPSITQSQQQQQQPPPQQQQQQSQPQSQEQKIDNNIAKAQSLIWPLKESLANTMKIAAQSVYQNSTIDSGMKSSDSAIPRFDKSLEEFYAICDQIETNLKTALECCILTSSSQRYTPIPMAKSDVNPENLGYSQYINTVRTQVAYAKEIHDALSLAARKITSNE